MAKPVLCIMGPTASGKTALACHLYQQFNAELISVDSSLVYRTMDIGTAKPTAEEQQAFPHHLIDLLQPDESYSASQFKQDAEALCEKSLAANRLPILVGGTMLYFKAFQQGLDELPESDPTIRGELQTRMKAEGLQTLYDELLSVDPASCERIHENDTQRILRALEVFYITAKPMSELWNEEHRYQSPFQFINVALIPAERSLLHARIAERFQSMLDKHFIEEVRELLDKGYNESMPSMRAVGYRQAARYIQGEYDIETMTERAVVATRQLAKRQMTWLRQWPDVQVFDPFNENFLDAVQDHLASCQLDGFAIKT